MTKENKKTHILFAATICIGISWLAFNFFVSRYQDTMKQAILSETDLEVSVIALRSWGDRVKFDPPDSPVSTLEASLKRRVVSAILEVFQYKKMLYQDPEEDLRLVKSALSLLQCDSADAYRELAADLCREELPSFMKKPESETYAQFDAFLNEALDL